AWPPPCCCTHPAPPRAPLFPYTTLFRSLVAGVADELRHSGISVFGPGRRAAGIEGSKSFAKDVMHAAGVPTAATMPIARPPCVVKADGLAAGEGVIVCHPQEELDGGLAEVSVGGGGCVGEESQGC